MGVGVGQQVASWRGSVRTTGGGVAMVLFL
jgi:hypothetical protein